MIEFIPFVGNSEIGVGCDAEWYLRGTERGDTLLEEKNQKTENTNSFVADDEQQDSNDGWESGRVCDPRVNVEVLYKSAYVILCTDGVKTE